MDNRRNYKKVFFVDAKDDFYVIGFSKKDINNFNETRILTQNSLFSNINIVCNEEYVRIYLPNVPKSFFMLAEILQEMGNSNA